MASTNRKTVTQPLWRAVAKCFLMAALAVLIGLSLVMQPDSLKSPAYRAISFASANIWGALYLVPGTMIATLLLLGTRRNAFIPMIFLAGYEMFWAATLLAFGVNHPMALTGAALFGIFGATTLLCAFTAAELP